MKNLIIEKFKSMGLPGGPNEMKFTDTIAVSVDGYKDDSKDRFNLVNIIPSNRITMKGVSFPVQAESNTGEKRIMYPGEEHSFNGDYVIEKPYLKSGGSYVEKELTQSEINDLIKKGYKVEIIS